MKKFPYYVIALIMLVIVFVFSAGGTIAAWTVQDDTVNKITIGSIKGLIIEEYVHAQTVMPGSTVEKVVSVKNTGNIDARIRVKIDKAWGASRDAEGNLIVDPSLSTDNILITFDTTNWYYEDADGYFYYIGVLPPGETTLTPLMREFTIDNDSGNEYDNKHADIVVHMECIQAAGGGLSAWSTNPDVLGAYIPGNGKTAIAEVVFVSPEDGFRFTTADGDLFVNFKGLIPGESQSQVIRITNEYSQNTEVFLRADYIDQSQATPENQALVDQLLKEYAVITITDSHGTVLYHGPVWGNLDIDSHGIDSAKYFISLGVFNSLTSGNITVNLSLDPAMDNKYQNLLGLIKWTFQAEGRETDYPVPRTGETYTSGPSLALIVLSGSLIIILVARRTKKSKEEKQMSEN
jgi:hypothetical protein